MASSKKKLVLVASEAMDSNRKEDRNENGLVRMSATARKFMGYGDEKVEIWPAGSTDNRVHKAIMLDIYQAFANDIRKLKQAVRDGELTSDQLKRVGFVTTRTFQRIAGKSKKKLTDSVWISNTIEDIVLGCDPEFLLVGGNGRIIEAKHVDDLNKMGKLGYDGGMAEVRPDPHVKTDGLVTNIKKIFNDDDLTYYIKKYGWRAACFHRGSNRDFPVGGHIHIGNPLKFAKMDGERRTCFFIVMNKVIDELLAIPLIRLDGDKGRMRRCESNMGRFGYFGEWRTCNGRLEHRTLSGMWMMHPSVAKAVLGTAKTIVAEMFKRFEKNNFNRRYVGSLQKGDRPFQSGFDEWKKINACKDFNCTTSSEQMANILNASDADKINKKFVSDWLKKMQELSTYKENSKYIRGLAEILKISRKTIDGWDCEIKNNWVKTKEFPVSL